MSLGFLKSITADVQLSDEEYVMNEKRRFVPLSVSPFREPRLTENSGEISTEEEVERPPEWLELAGDLAWTASFSSITSNTTITEPIAVWNYAVFFALTWHLWATQTTYDIKYYTNDWWHRGLFASQLATYAILAAVSGSFNIGWEISSDAMNPFTGNNTALTGEAIRENEVLSMKTSLIGVNIVLFVSRMLLFLQYLRVLWYRRWSKHVWSWRFYLPAASTFIAGCFFLGCFIMLTQSDAKKSVAVAQLTLWTFAIAIQALATAFTLEDPENVLKSKSTLTRRLSTLTVIIMGEGLNGMCSTLRNSTNSLGLTPTMIAEASSMLLVLYFVWLLYFDGFRINSAPNRGLDELWLWFHFPLHLSLILLLEGIKNMFIAGSVFGAAKLLLEAFMETINFTTTNGELPEHPRIEALLLPLKMSWQQEVEDLANTLDSVTDDADPAPFAQLYRWLLTTIHNIYLLFYNQPDPEAEYDFSNFLSSNDTVVAEDLSGDGILMGQFIARYNALMAYSAHWLLAVAGTLLLCMAILNCMQRRPRNRFAWGYTFNRAIIGSIIIIIGGATSKCYAAKYRIYFIIPIITLGYGAAAMADWLVLLFSIHSIRKKETWSSASSTYPKDNADWGSAVNVRHFSERYYTQAALMQRSSMESLSSASGLHPNRRMYYPQDAVFDPYAEAGVPHYPTSYRHYRQESGGSLRESPTQTIFQGNRQEAIP